MNGFVILLVIGPLLRQQLAGQHYILQCGILRKQVKGLEHHAKVQTALPQFCIRQAFLALCVKNHLAIDGYGPLVCLLQIGQAAEQSGLAASGDTDDSNRLSLFQGKTDILQNVSGSKTLTDVFYV